MLKNIFRPPGFYRALACLILLLMGTAFPAFAGGAKKFQLKDGSVIQAEIQSYANGVYKLKSDALGSFELTDDKINQIQFGASRRSSRSNSADGSFENLTLESLGMSQNDLKQMEEKLLSDPKSVKILQDLQTDPAMQKILKDKDLMDAVNKGDLGRVSQDPKIKSLMNSKKLEELLDRTQ